MKLPIPKRGVVFFLAILLIAGGIAWTTYKERSQEPEGEGFPTTGYVSSVRRDSVGCSNTIPFAAKDCRFVARIHHRVTGTTIDQSYTYVGKYYFLPPPSLQGGEPVTGICMPTGHCHFDQLKEKPYGLGIALLSLFGAMGVGGWIYRQRRQRG